jgi:hypothetical protein
VPPSSGGPVTQRKPVLAGQGRPTARSSRSARTQNSAVPYPSGAQAAGSFITMATSAGGRFGEPARAQARRPAPSSLLRGGLRSDLDLCLKCQVRQCDSRRQWAHLASVARPGAIPAGCLCGLAHCATSDVRQPARCGERRRFCRCARVLARLSQSYGDPRRFNLDALISATIQKVANSLFPHFRMLAWTNDNFAQCPFPDTEDQVWYDSQDATSVI